MRYYIKADVKLKLGDSSLFPCACNLEFGTVLADEVTGSLFTSYVDAVKPPQIPAIDIPGKLGLKLL